MNNRCDRIAGPRRFRNLECRWVVFAGMLAMMGGLGSISGCQRPSKEPPQKQADTLVVPIAKPVSRVVTETVEYTGRTDAVQAVSIRARVTGYLTKMPFQEGSEVNAGDLLFEIDPRPYQAILDEAQSQVDVYTAQWKLATKTLERDRSLGGAVSQQQLDQDVAQVEEANARIKMAQSTVQTAKLNLEFTKIRSPISGRISRYFYTLGNLVTQDQTLLTTVVSMNPMYVYFDLDERTYHRLTGSFQSGKPGTGSIESWLQELPVRMGLEGETGFPHEGKINFINNQVNPSTGTIAVRGVFANRQLRDGVWWLTPGMFTRIRLPIGEPASAVLVIDRAIGSDQGLKYVYVIDAENQVQYRRVKVGALQEDGLRVIEEGLDADEWVAVGALQQLRPKLRVERQEMRMPTIKTGEPIPVEGAQAKTPNAAKS
ncbi:efflux RND transporter periplasmic adaptor subunit [Tuwongella immobilis]|uniref:Uncharacterized protein n=1 Tax=Tuwongella immobilis TaxID=692036 RepID=A0A6C2YRC6_9BACT|nr:efflux RND transporter periplasmic adaptor subunit [Tuwongella immobilis]VIP03422.1 rnd transporter : RND family efflux transporter, MFP subunit OS=Singulisphaera acidiphila (strain ATCC BAA-1392 / DSM 18658 / VKM B-2454 / MOB10) GN=Sinac_7473 PE=4 SV=1: HlyD [Tuwongella immobilis]VTS04216.1 rnd transporter : RND family efflux transporter, MFP subunit OS=Singulisphaera acidiphila (strain ATCC BAA-1392 / DSM 18658 / VKM B-2454 / MOB10) GN=Sinac_7473 PE=4 SV=1: HlyD [Tuwongella immobilis]